MVSLAITNWDLIPNSHNGVSEPIDFSVMEKLQRLDISRLTFRQAPLLPSLLMSLDMTKCSFRHTSTIVAIESPRLQRLSIADLNFKNVDGLQGLTRMLLPSKGNLTHFDASGVNLAPFEIRQLIIDGYFDFVEELRLNQSKVNDEVVELLAPRLPRLKALYLASTKVTGCSIRLLMQQAIEIPRLKDYSRAGCNARKVEDDADRETDYASREKTRKERLLKFLCVDNCSNMGVDAVEWARSLGLTVAFSFPQSRSGRQIA